MASDLDLSQELLGGVVPQQLFLQSVAIGSLFASGETTEQQSPPFTNFGDVEDEQAGGSVLSLD